MQSEICEERDSTFLSCSITSFSVLCPQDSVPKARVPYNVNVKAFQINHFFSEGFCDIVSMFVGYYG
jgi:hypothetical protein